MMHFPYFRFPPLFRLFRSLGKISHLFPKKCMFHPQKFPTTLFVVGCEFRISLLFSQNAIFPLLFRKNYYFSPTFSNFPPDFVKFTCFYIQSFTNSFIPFGDLHSASSKHYYSEATDFTCFSFPPYFDHDAFMHHTMHYWTPLLITLFIHLRFRRSWKAQKQQAITHNASTQILTYKTAGSAAGRKPV